MRKGCPPLDPPVTRLRSINRDLSSLQAALENSLDGCHPPIPSKLAEGKHLEALDVLATHPLFFKALGTRRRDLAERLAADEELTDILIAFNPQGLVNLVNTLPGQDFPDKVWAFHHNPVAGQVQAVDRVRPFAYEVVALQVPWMSGSASHDA